MKKSELIKLLENASVDDADIIFEYCVPAGDALRVAHKTTQPRVLGGCADVTPVIWISMTGRAEA